jgi:hypothetical protein
MRQVHFLPQGIGRPHNIRIPRKKPAFVEQLCLPYRALAVALQYAEGAHEQAQLFHNLH